MNATRDNVLAARDTAEDATGVVRQEPFRSHLVTVLRALLRDAEQTRHNLDTMAALMLISAWAISASRRSNIGSLPQPVAHRSPRLDTSAPTESPIYADRPCTARVRRPARIRPEKRVGLDRIPGKTVRPDRPECRQVSAYLDAEALAQILLGNRAGSDPHRRLPGRRTTPPR